MKKMIVAVAFLVLGAVVGVIVLLGSEEKVVPQAKVAKVTITCELGRSEFDVDCDGIADTADSDPTVANPDQGVAECQTWRDCDGVCDSETERGIFVHCWTSLTGPSSVAVRGCMGWSIKTGPGDGLDGRSICSSPWHVLAEVKDTTSICLKVVLTPGQYIEYNTESDQAPFWGASGPYPPGEISGFHTTTLDGMPVNPTLVDNRMGGSNFRFLRL